MVVIVMVAVGERISIWRVLSNSRSDACGSNVDPYMVPDQNALLCEVYTIPSMSDVGMWPTVHTQSALLLATVSLGDHLTNLRQGMERKYSPFNVAA